MNDSILEEIIRGYVSSVIHMSLATCQENTPWITEVHFSYDSDLNLYFLSRPNRRHSIEGRENKRVAGNIVKQYMIGERVTGIYFEGEIAELFGTTAKDLAFITYRERFSTDSAILDEQKQENGHKFYKIRVHRFFVFDENILEYSGKYELSWNI